MGCSVLVASYTHGAVDNILIRLKAVSVDFVRIGNLSQVHRDVHSHILGGPCLKDTSTKALKKLADTIRVVQ